MKPSPSVPYAAGIHRAPQDALSTPLVLLLAVVAGLADASLYYSRPMLPLLAHDMGTSDRTPGLVPTLTQLGYAAGTAALAVRLWPRAHPLR